MVGKANLPKQQVIDNFYLKDVDIYVLLIYTYRKKALNFGVSVLNVKFDSKFKRDWLTICTLGGEK